MGEDAPPITIRTFTCEDLPASLAIQAGAYPAFLVESEAAFASRITAAAPYSLVAQVGDRLGGYLLAHGWPPHAPPALGTPLDQQMAGGILFLHDCAVARDARGLGIGRRLVGHAFALAVRDGLTGAELVAVEGADRFWEGLGFAPLVPSPAMAAKLAAYGPAARWMGRALP